LWAVLHCFKFGHDEEILMPKYACAQSHHKTILHI